MSTGKGLHCYRQHQEFLPPFETPQCYLIVGKAPPGPGLPCPGGVLFPCFGKHRPGTRGSGCGGTPGQAAVLGSRQPLPGLCQELCMFDWDVAQPGGGSGPPVPSPVLLAATAELPRPLRASTALDKAPQAPKTAPMSHLRMP